MAMFGESLCYGLCGLQQAGALHGEGRVTDLERLKLGGRKEGRKADC